MNCLLHETAGMEDCNKEYTKELNDDYKKQFDNQNVSASKMASGSGNQLSGMDAAPFGA